MPFDSGAVTVSIFELPEALGNDAVSAFAAKKAGALASVAEDAQVGWVTGRHLLENDINDGNAWAGGCLYLNLRKVQRKVPGALLNAICKREELVYMLAHETAFVPRVEKKKIKEDANEKLLPKMPPVPSGVPLVYDPAAKVVYVGSASVTQLDELLGMFLKTTGLEPLPWNIESMLFKHFQVTESALPVLSFADGAAVAATPGRDFLTWLWFDNEAGAGGVEHPQYGKFELLIEGPFLFAGDADAHGSAETAIKKGDCPSRSAEAKAALSVGKKLRKARFTLARDNEFWSGTFDADRFAFGSLKLPEGEELEPDACFGERMQNLLIFKEIFELFFCRYAESMLHRREEELAKLRRWVEERDAL